jgi:hypothetical protein
MQIPTSFDLVMTYDSTKECPIQQECRNPTLHEHWNAPQKKKTACFIFRFSNGQYLKRVVIAHDHLSKLLNY